MVLSELEIVERVEQGNLSINPFVRENVEPASVDVRLGSEFKEVRNRFLTSGEGPVVFSEGVSDEYKFRERTGSVLLEPGDFVLGTTLESVTIPETLAARILGRSTVGRLGVSIHQTAGFIDPGFEGQVTLELSNHGPSPIEFTEGDRVAQLVFHEITGEIDNPYGHDGSHYQNQTGPTEPTFSISRKT